MNPIPFLALAAVASGYAVATERLDQYFANMPEPEIVSYAASADGEFSVYDVMADGSDAVTEPTCQTNDALAATLTHDFAETPVAQAVEGDGLVMQLWSSDLMGTWTMVHRGTDGISCIVSSGIGWTTASTPADVFDNVFDADSVAS